jgi:hypothetical protein
MRLLILLPLLYSLTVTSRADEASPESQTERAVERSARRVGEVTGRAFASTEIFAGEAIEAARDAAEEFADVAQEAGARMREGFQEGTRQIRESAPAGDPNAPELSWAENNPPQHINRSELASSRFHFQAERGAAYAEIDHYLITLDGQDPTRLNQPRSGLPAWAPPVNLATAEHELRIVAVDVEGRRSRAIRCTFTVLSSD